MKYSEILALNRQLEQEVDGERYTIAVLSNIVVSPIKEILETVLRAERVNAHVHLGNYDNIVQDSANAASFSAIVIFAEAANILDGFHYRAATMSMTDLEAVTTRVSAEMDLLFDNLATAPLVLMNRFSALAFDSGCLAPTPLEKVCDRLNLLLEQKKPPNVTLINIEKIVARTSATAAFDLRYFNSARALYTIEFLRRYADHVKPVFLSACGRTRKALVLDGDNTLWGGVLGEEGPMGVATSDKTPQGSMFRQVQHLILGLHGQGVMLGLCTKNNQTDIDELFSTNVDMVLRKEHFSAIRANWEDKVTNIRSMAKEWNIGLDSIVFVDDSEFELGLVRKALPEVVTLKVPAMLHEYPELMRSATNLFFRASTTSDDLERNARYRADQLRKAQRDEYVDLDDYLRSLGIQLSLEVNRHDLVPRIAQLTQKTNQFNLTTRRYTDSQIFALMMDPNSQVVSLEASDRFGTYGVTGVAILRYRPIQRCAEIDSFLLSCRVIGRNIEFSLIDYVVDLASRAGARELYADYLPTSKNQQVADFYERSGFRRTEAAENRRTYTLTLEEYVRNSFDYIECKLR